MTTDNQGITPPHLQNNGTNTSGDGELRENIKSIVSEATYSAYTRGLERQTDSSVVYEDHVDQIMQEVHANIRHKVQNALQRVEAEVIGGDVPSDFDHDDGFCQNCDFQPTDGTENCICKIVTKARRQQRKSLTNIKQEYKTGENHE